MYVPIPLLAGDGCFIHINFCRKQCVYHSRYELPLEQIPILRSVLRIHCIDMGYGHLGIFNGPVKHLNNLFIELIFTGLEQLNFQLTTRTMYI